MLEIRVKIECPDLVQAVETISKVLLHNVIPSPQNSETTTQVIPSKPASAPSGVSTHSNPAFAVPVAEVPAYTLDQISRAGASLVDAGKMEPLQALLGRYGVQAITQLRPETYGAFATDLRGLGAQI